MATSTTILDSYYFDFTNTTIYHKDLVLPYDGNTGTAPSFGDYVRDSVTGATGKVIAGTDLGGTAGTGTITLSRVKGRFGNNNHLDVLDTLGFDTVDSAKNGFARGDTIDEQGAGTAQIIVDDVEFNWPGFTAGDGIIYGRLQVTGFLDNDNLDNTTSGETTVAIVNATGETDNSALFTTALVNSATGGTSPTITGIIHYDAGTVDITTDADVYAGTQDTGTLTSTGTIPSDGDTVTLGAKTYTFRTTLTPTVNEVLIGAAAINSIRNLASAINGTGTEGTDYANGTTPNVDATAAITSATTLVAESIKPNPAVAIASAETSAQLSWGATALTGGVGNTGRGNNYGRTRTSVTATGSIILNDIDGSFADNDSLYLDGELAYDNVQAGQKFKVGDVVKGGTSGARGRIIALPTGTTMLLAEQTGRFEDNEQIQTVARDESTTYVADANGTDGLTTAVATINHPNSAPCPRFRQSEDLQGGIYDTTHSLNDFRRSRRFFNMVMTEFANDFDKFDDKIPMDGSVKNGNYRMKNSWFQPDENYYYLTTGAWTDETSENIFINPQVIGTIFRVDAGAWGNAEVAPQIYCSQDGVLIEPYWLEGYLDINVKIKTTTNTKYTTATAGEGAIIDNGQITVFNRFKTHTYSTSRTEANDTGGVVTVALGTQDDLQDVTETHDFAYTTGSGTWNAGEEIVAVTAGVEKVGVVVSADTGATGNVQYILKSGTNFANSDVVTGQYSQVAKTVNGAPTTVVAGYSDKIGFGTVDARYDGGTTSGTFYVGEPVTQTATGATGIFLEDDTSSIYIDELTGTFNGTDTITGDNSSATYTPTSRNVDTNAPKDIGDEVDNDYSVIIGADRTNTGSGRTILQVYEYLKYVTAKEADSSIQLQGGRGSGSPVQGRFYRTVDTSFVEVTASPYGIMGGPDLFIGAQSVFVEDLAAADIQKISLTDDVGTGETPPNLQTLTFDQVASGDNLSVFRTTTGETIATGEWSVDTPGAGQNQSADSIINVANGSGVGARTLGGGTDLPNDIPTTGTIRAEDPNNAGLFLSFQYDSRVKTGANAADFNLSTNARQPNGQIGDVTSSTDLVSGDDVHVMLMQRTATTTSETQTIEHVSDINFLGVLRKRGLNPFRVTGTFNGTAGATITAVRQDDPVVDFL